MILAEIIVHGLPKAQPRAKARNIGKHAGVYTPKTANDWKGDVIRSSASLRPERPLEGPTRVEIDWFLPRPKNLCRKKDPERPIWAPRKPDRDNLEKAVLDALTDDHWFRDDCVVVCGEPRKMYHSKSGGPGAVIRIYTDIPEPLFHGRQYL